MKRSHSLTRKKFCEMLVWIMCDIKITSFCYFRLHDQKLCQCYARQQEVAKGSNIRSWCKILNENVWSRLNVESNSTQTYLCGDTQRQQRKAERRKRTSSLIFVLPMFPCVSSPVIHVSLAFRTRLILGDPGADGGDEKNKSFLTPIRSQNDGDLLELVL